MDKLTTNQKQNYEAIKAMCEAIKAGKVVVPPRPNPMNDPRVRVWMWLYLQGRSQTTKQITKAVRHYEQAQVITLLTELVARGRVGHNGSNWWVVSLTMEPVIE
jgi:hypothetical protein